MSDATTINCRHCGEALRFSQWKVLKGEVPHCASCSRLSDDGEEQVREVLPRRSCIECGDTEFLLWRLKEEPLHAATCRGCGLTTLRAQVVTLTDQVKTYRFDVDPATPYR